MPRPKVLPENRTRAYRACDSCKASKTRCDSKLPCASCIRRNRPGKCTYQAANPGRRSTRHNTDINSPNHAHAHAHGRSSSRPGSWHSFPPPLSPATETNGEESPGLSAVAVAAGAQSLECTVNRQPLRGIHRSSCTSASISSPASRGTASSVAAAAAAAATVGGPGDQESPKEHFVPGSNGERVYIGENTSLSFLDFLRHTLRPLVGSTPFTDGERQNLMLEPDVDDVAGADATPSPEEKRALFQSYLEVTSGILHLFTSDEAKALLEGPSSDHHAENLAAMEAALAIGAQARASSSSPREAQYAAMYFSRARQMAFKDMLANPSVAIVRLFLLLSFFILGACRQNAASIYLGIASKAAVVLGLHLPLSWNAAQRQSWPDSRLRVWHSLCILDVLTSSLLGRPCTVPRASRHNLQSLPLHDDEPSFNAMLRGAALLDDICLILNRGVIIDVPTAQDLLDRLRQWCGELPPSLRRFSFSDRASLSNADRKLAFSRAHASGFYYFAVILVTRPFLISTLMSQLRQRSGSRSGTDTRDTEVAGDPTRFSLSQVCMSSAVYMGHLCRQFNSILTEASLPFGNLSLFKAWAFGAGLVLGFSIFAGESRNDITEAFQDVVKLLSKIAEVSPQSRLYSETLKALSEALSVHQRMSSYKARRAAEKYIEQLLVIDVDEDMASRRLVLGGDGGGSGRESEEANGSRLFSNWDATALPSSDLLGLGEEDPSIGGGGSVHMGDSWLADQGWDNLAMQFSDNFAMDFGAGVL